jgi:hypothetical protein
MSVTGGWNPPNNKQGGETLGGEEIALFSVAYADSVLYRTFGLESNEVTFPILARFGFDPIANAPMP